ncbi:MAG: caspase family protein [Thiomargarita sp.]|nr:caspase family protein [Thiomargarita sp.]
MKKAIIFINLLLILFLNTSCVKENVVPFKNSKNNVQKSTNKIFQQDKPILRLETGMHTAKINRIDIDAAERFLVTGSDDKTIRIWSLATGKLLRILRPPIGEGNEGKIYAVAISPDGKTIAAGGWTKGKWSGAGNHKIYLFDRASGKLRQQITGLPKNISAILHLAYSPDGRYLVTSLGGKNGIRIYRSSDYNLVAKDTDYNNDSYWAEFDNSGKLVSSCLDGYIRLYDQQFNLVKKRKAVGGNLPYAVRFSPMGDKIAVGFADSTQINVLAAKNLELLYRPDTQGVNNGNLARVAWSQDGRTLYAGGQYDKDGLSPILHWSQAGKDKRYSWTASPNTITDIKTLQTGAIVFGASDPAFGKFTAQGKKTLYREAGIADFRGIFAGDFLVSATADKIQFGFKYGGNQPALFSLTQRILKLEPSKQSELIKPKISSLNISNWKNTNNPKLNGKTIALEQYEISRCLAITPDNKHFLLGTTWSLRFFKKNGQLQWQQSVPGVVWGVNIAGNGKVAVAAFGDGTIRWYRLTDGEELFAFFPHKDGKRWVVWTPQGYYAASAGGDELVGWHLNRENNQAADFFPTAQFRERYYRPDIITKVLDTLDIKLALVLADKKQRISQQKIEQLLPPVITLLSPQEGDNFDKPTINIRYQIRSPSGEPITSLRIRIDGRIVETKKQNFKTNKEYIIQLAVPKRDINLAIIAKNRYTTSEPAMANLYWQGLEKDETFEIKPKLYVLAVGVSNYDNSMLKLDYAAKDARDFANFFKFQKDSSLYREIEVKLLADATKDDILQGLKWIEQKTTRNDVAMVFFAGHGVNDNNNRYYFFPRDINIDRLKQTGLAYHVIKNTITVLAGKSIFFVDTCHSGNVIGSRGDMADIDKIVNDLTKAENGVVVFASSTGKQSSFENTAWKNGAFTKALVEGLNSSADYTKDGNISINELDLYLSERVKKLTNGEQTPTTSKPTTIPDFLIAVVKK